MDKPVEKKEWYDVKPILTPEMIIGIVVWEAAHGEISYELLELVDTIDPEWAWENLPDDLNQMVEALQGARRDLDINKPWVKRGLIHIAWSEIGSTLVKKQQEQENE